MNKHPFECGWSSVAMGLAMALAAALGGCSSGKMAPDKAITEVPANSFMTQWRSELPLNGRELSRLVLNDDTIFAQTRDNTCFWISRGKGHLMTQMAAAAPKKKIYDPVTLADRVAFPSPEEIVYFSRTGKFMHRYAMPYNGSSHAAGDNNKTVFTGVDHPNGGRLLALDAGRQPYGIVPNWQLMTRGQVSATPAYYDGMVFLASRDGGVYAVSAEKCNPLWPSLSGSVYQTGGEILAALAVDKDGLYVASMDSKLYCLDLNNGRAKWIYYAGRPLKEEAVVVPATGTNYVYLYVPGTGMICIDKSGRQEIRKAAWIMADATQLLAADAKYAFLRSSDNRILAVEHQTGQVAFRSKSNDFAVFATNTTAKDSTIYAASDKGVVYAIKAVLKPGTIGQLALDVRPIGSMAAAN